MQSGSKSPYTVHAGAIAAIYHTLKLKGLDATTIFSQFKIPLAVLVEPQLRVEVVQVKSLWQAITALTGDDALSLEVHEAFQGTGINLSVLASACENLLEAAQVMEKFSALASTAICVSIVTQKNFKGVIKAVSEEADMGPEAMDYLMSRVVSMVAQVTHPSIRPIEIKLQRKKPKQFLKFDQHFNCPLLYSQNENAICYNMKDALQPFVTRNIELRHHMESYIEKYFNTQLNTDNSSQLIKQIVQHLPTLLQEKNATIASVAEHLNMSQRTVQRKLKDSNVSFQSLLNSSRLERAFHYLKQNEHNIDAISDLLGFASHTSFLRFFKEQTGFTVKEYKMKHKLD